MHPAPNQRALLPVLLCMPHNMRHSDHNMCDSMCVRCGAPPGWCSGWFALLGWWWTWHTYMLIDGHISWHTCSECGSQDDGDLHLRAVSLTTLAFWVRPGPRAENCPLYYQAMSGNNLLLKQSLLYDYYTITQCKTLWFMRCQNIMA